MALGRSSGRLFLLLAVSLLSHNILFSQDLVETYSRFIPKSYMYNEFKHEQLSKLLRAKSSIHPDLIYYYITYYNKLSEKSGILGENEANAFKVFLSLKENILLQKRNDWAERQIWIIDTMKTDHVLKNRVKDMFRELITELFDVSSYPQNADTLINESLLNYFSALFYNPESYKDYHSDLSYFSNKKDEETRLRERIFTLFEAAERKHPNSNAELISLILDRWYLFDTLPEDKSKRPEAGEMVINLLKQNAVISSNPNFSFGIMYSPFNYACNLKPSIEIKGLGRKEEFALRNSIPQIGFSAGYRYYLKDVVGLFSSINFQFLYFTRASLKTPSNSLGFSRDYTASIYTYHEELSFSRSVVTPKSAQSFYVKISTPLLFLLNTISVDLGAYGGVNSLKYKYEYEYKYVKTESYYAGDMWDPHMYTRIMASGIDNRNYESTQDDIIFSPIIELSINSMGKVSMGIEVSLQYSSFSLEYEF